MEKVSIGSIQLGIPTDKKFLTGLIPDQWSEKVYEHDNFWACKCKRNDQVTSKNWVKKDGEFNNICDNIISEFGDMLMEIYSITSSGIHFVVYLRKNKSKNHE